MKFYKSDVSERILYLHEEVENLSYYVFSGSEVMCQMCPGAKGKLNANDTDNNVKKSNSNIITTDIKPDMDIEAKCILPTNPAVLAAQSPQPCINPIWIGDWINIEPCFAYAENKTLLLNTAVRICAYGGVMKIISPSNDFIVNTGVNGLNIDRELTKKIENQRSEYNEKAVLTKNMPEKDQLPLMSDKALTYANRSIANIYSEYEGFETETIFKDKKGIVTDNGNMEDEARRVKDSNEKLYNPSLDGVCSGNCPEQYAGTCPLKNSVPASTVTLANENNSTILKKNMKNDGLSPEDEETCRKIDVAASKIGDKFECKPAYHHIISGNQCLNKNKFLVTLANFYGYDVNNSKNAVILPTISKKDKNVSNEEWTRAKYDVIRETGSQLHLGNHAYGSNFDFESGSEYMRDDVAELKDFIYNDETKKIADYQSVVDSHLERIAYNHKNVLKDSCRMSVSPEQKEAEKKAFFELMDNLSADIKESILDYPTSEAYTENFYVSNFAMAYDMSKNKSYEEFKVLLNGGKQI